MSAELHSRLAGGPRSNSGLKRFAGRWRDLDSGSVALGLFRRRRCDLGNLRCFARRPRWPLTCFLDEPHPNLMVRIEFLTAIAEARDDVATGPVAAVAQGALPHPAQVEAMSSGRSFDGWGSLIEDYAV